MVSQEVKKIGGNSRFGPKNEKEDEVEYMSSSTDGNGSVDRESIRVVGCIIKYVKLEMNRPSFVFESEWMSLRAVEGRPSEVEGDKKRS